MTGQAVLSELQAVAQQYLDGIHHGDVDLLKRVMHPDCRMVCHGQGDYSNIGMAEYFTAVAGRQSPQELGEPRLEEVLAISQVDGQLATIRLRCLVLGKYCEDALTLVSHGGKWRIISKVFTYRPRHQLQTE